MENKIPGTGIPYLFKATRKLSSGLEEIVYVTETTETGGGSALYGVINANDNLYTHFFVPQDQLTISLDPDWEKAEAQDGSEVYIISETEDETIAAFKNNNEEYEVRTYEKGAIKELPKKEETTQPEKEGTTQPEKERTTQPEKERTTQPEKEGTTQPEKERTTQPEKEETPPTDDNPNDNPWEIDFKGDAYNDLVSKIASKLNISPDDARQQLAIAAQTGADGINQFLRDKHLDPSGFEEAFTAAFANPTKIEWPVGCSGLTDEITDILARLNDPGDLKGDVSKLDKTKNGFKAVHYEYWDLGTNNGKKSAEFSQNAQTVLQSVDKITSMLNDKSTIWKGTGKAEAEKLAKELKNEASELYKAVQLLQEVANDVDKMAMLSKEMMEAQAQQEAYEKLKEDAKKALDALKSNEPHPEKFEYTDNDGKTHSYPNPAHVAWASACAALEAKITEYQGKEDEYKAKAKAADDKITEYEKAIDTVQNAVRKVNDANKDGTKPKDSPGGNGGGGGGGHGGGGGGGDGGQKKTTPKTEPPKLEDTTQKQMEYYKKLSFEQLNLISQYLTEIAKANNTTVEKLLTDSNFAGILASSLGSIESLPKELTTLISQGDPSSTQELVYQIFTGQKPEVMALNDYTKSSIYTYLSVAATENNVTISDLISQEKYHDVVKSALSNYGDVVKTLSGLTDDALTEKVIDIYDGNGIDSLKEGEIDIIRDYAVIMSIENNISTDEYLTKNTLPSDFRNLGKTSVFTNMLSSFGFEKTKSVLLSIFSSSN